MINHQDEQDQMWQETRDAAYTADRPVSQDLKECHHFDHLKRFGHDHNGVWSADCGVCAELDAADRPVSQDATKTATELMAPAIGKVSPDLWVAMVDSIAAAIQSHAGAEQVSQDPEYVMELAVGKEWSKYKVEAERIVARIADNDCLTCKHWKADAVYAIAVELAHALTISPASFRLFSIG